MPIVACKLPSVHVSSLKSLSKRAAGVTLVQCIVQRAATRRRAGFVSNALPLPPDLWLPSFLPGIGPRVSDLAFWFLSHPFWTLVAGTVLVTIVPRVTKALWRYIFGPVLLVGIGFFVGKNPEAAANSAQALLNFGQAHPAAMSLAILATVAILITPYLIPLLLTVVICLVLWNPKALTNMLPAPSVPSWMIPGPLKVITSPKTWLQSLDARTQSNQPDVDPDSFNPIKRFTSQDKPSTSEARKFPAFPMSEQPLATASGGDASSASSDDSRPRRLRDRLPDLDTDFQVPRLAPEQAVSLPIEQVPPENSSGASSEWSATGRLKGFLGSLGASPVEYTSKADADAASTAACANGKLKCEPGDLNEAATAGLLERAKGMKPFEAMGKATGKLQALAPGRQAGEMMNEAQIETQQDEEARGSRVAAVKARVQEMVPDRLRRNPSDGSNKDQQADQDASEQQSLLRDGEEKVEGALKKIKGKVSGAAEGLTAEDSAARRLGERIKGKVGGAVSSGAALVSGGKGAEVGMQQCEEPGQSDADSSGQGSLRRLARRIKGAKSPGEPSVQLEAEDEAQKRCTDGSSVASRSAEDESAGKTVNDRDPSTASTDQAVDQPVASRDQMILSALGTLRFWTMFW